jgi:acetoin utilization deacetylase AcuC-like enzyme
METLYFTHPSSKRHEMGDWHPECPQRLDAVSDQLLMNGLMPFLRDEQAPAASREALLRVHGADYLDSLCSLTPKEGYRTISPDTIMNPHTYQAALHAAGAGIAAVDAVMQGQAMNAFCAVRPPGHHALPNEAMGFCFINNIAVAAQHALHAHGVTKLAIIDFDVHHGNGTEVSFAGDDRVLMCSFFQNPLFPNCGTDNPAFNMVNIPVPAYTGGQEVRSIVQDVWLPKLNVYAPELILISAGFDAHREDDMGQMRLIEADYRWITEQIMEVADRHSKGRIVSILEGGYNLSALGRSVVAHLRALTKL